DATVTGVQTCALPISEAAYREALRLRPEHPALRRGLGVSLYWQGRHAEAEVAFREAIRVKPDYVRAHCDLGEMFGERQRWADAEIGRASCRRTGWARG